MAASVNRVEGCQEPLALQWPHIPFPEWANDAKIPPPSVQPPFCRLPFILVCEVGFYRKIKSPSRVFFMTFSLHDELSRMDRGVRSFRAQVAAAWIYPERSMEGLLRIAPEKQPSVSTTGRASP
jgi:hypothetical protein